MQVVRARTNCGRRLIGLQIPAKLTDIVKNRISSGPPLHSAIIDLAPGTTSHGVVAEKANDRCGKRSRIKQQRETEFFAPACGIEHTIDGTETEEDDCDPNAGWDKEDQLVTDQGGASDLIASGLWQANDEAETLYVEANISSTKLPDLNKLEKTRRLRSGADASK